MSFLQSVIQFGLSVKNALHNKSLHVDNVGSLDVFKASWYFNPGNVTDIALFCMFSSVSVSCFVRLVCHAGQAYSVIGTITDL